VPRFPRINKDYYHYLRPKSFKTLYSTQSEHPQGGFLKREIAHAKQSEGVLVYKCVCVCFCVALSERSSTPVTATPVSAFQPVRSSSNHFNNTQIVTPYTLNSQPSALNPEPQIFKPRPQAFRAFEPVCVSSE